jgi:hypothetical protein
VRVGQYGGTLIESHVAVMCVSHAACSMTAPWTEFFRRNAAQMHRQVLLRQGPQMVQLPLM